MDCKKDATFCQETNIMKMPTFTFYPGPDVDFDGHQLETTRGEGIVRYLNEVLGPSFSLLSSQTPTCLPRAASMSSSADTPSWIVSPISS